MSQHIPTIQQILTVAGIACDCTAADICGPSQAKRLNMARRIVATLLRETRGMNYSHIADVLNRSPNSIAIRCRWTTSPALTHARALLAKLYADDQAMRIASFTVGEIIAAIETRQDVAVAVGCYLGEIMRRKHGTQTHDVPGVQRANESNRGDVRPVSPQAPRAGSGETADVQQV